MSATIFDLAATADALRVMRATGQDKAPLIPAVIALRVGDYCYDPVSKLSGQISYFKHRDGETKAVLMNRICSFPANLPDLLPDIRPSN